MARTRTTIRRIDPWSVLKFSFVANLVLFGILLLVGTMLWVIVRRLELIETICELAGTVGITECGVDGGALFDLFLVLGLLGVVIQTGILVFLTFLANLISDLTGGIVVTLDDDRPRSGGPSGLRLGRGGAGSARGGSASTSGSSSASTTGRIPSGAGAGSSGGSSSTSASSATTASGSRPWPGDRMTGDAAGPSGGAQSSSTDGDGDSLFG